MPSVVDNLRVRWASNNTSGLSTETSPNLPAFAANRATTSKVVGCTVTTHSICAAGVEASKHAACIARVRMP